VNDLPGYLARQRWFAGTGPPTTVEVLAVEKITDQLASLIVVTDAGTYHVLDGPEDWPAVLARVAPDEQVQSVRPMGVEQSNTSVVFDERIVLKVFRRVHPGRNLDVATTSALAHVGFPHVAQPLAVWDADGYVKGVVQPFLASGEEGWALAVRPGGADFTPEAAELGELTAELHEAMERAFGAGPGRPGEWADTIEAGLARLPDPAERAAARAVVERLRRVSNPGPSMQVHGDYHLGQVLRSGGCWYVLDFEGEPAQPPEERGKPTSPMKDVTGMLRSFGYAAAVGGAGPDWERACREAFLAAYRSRLPLPDAAVLEAFELDKAIYELDYERAYRPDWVDVPRQALDRLLTAS
jgi:maltokinase